MRDESANGGSLRSKIGLATGHAYPYNFEWFEGAPMDVLGLTVDRAACLAKIAQPGQILVDGPLRRRPHSARVNRRVTPTPPCGPHWEQGVG